MKKVKILVSCANHLHSYTAGEELELEDEIADGLGPYAEVIESLDSDNGETDEYLPNEVDGQGPILGATVSFQTTDQQGQETIIPLEELAKRGLVLNKPEITGDLILKDQTILAVVKSQVEPEKAVEPSNDPEKTVKVKPAKKLKPEKAVEPVKDAEKAIEPEKQVEKAVEPEKELEKAVEPEKPTEQEKDPEKPATE